MTSGGEEIKPEEKDYAGIDENLDFPLAGSERDGRGGESGEESLDYAGIDGETEELSNTTENEKESESEGIGDYGEF